MGVQLQTEEEEEEVVVEWSRTAMAILHENEVCMIAYPAGFHEKPDKFMSESMTENIRIMPVPYVSYNYSYTHDLLYQNRGVIKDRKSLKHVCIRPKTDCGSVWLLFDLPSLRSVIKMKLNPS